MLGEGYDHCYLSVAAIFRPFRNELPYVQFIGRILRYIYEAETALDNIGQIISHKHLGLEELWKKYKVEINESEVIKYLSEQDIDLDETSSSLSKESTRKYDTSLGSAQEKGDGYTNSDPYLTTLLIQKHSEQTAEFNKKVLALQELLSISEEEAKKMVHMSESNNNVALKRPDLYYNKTREDIDVKIKQEMVPALLTKYNIPKDATSLSTLRIFSEPRYRWIVSKMHNNAGMLAVYFNTYLKYEMGKSREEWSIDDYKLANQKLDTMYNYIDTSLQGLLQ